LHATLSVSGRVSAIVLGMAGWATARASGDQLAALRKNPVVPADKQPASGFLKNSDDQTVLALTAITRAMATLRRPTMAFQDWGVVAAPNLFGRAGIFQSLLGFRRDGAWGVTPHMIPHHSLHAVSGTISQALGLYGPNFGVGGGPHAVAEALLAAATMVSENTLPGLWVVMSGHDTEYLPDASSPQVDNPATCLAAALALMQPTSAKFASYLLVSACSEEGEHWSEFNLPRFLSALALPIPAGRWSLPGGGCMCFADSVH
jgi:hypothetical protein